MGQERADAAGKPHGRFRPDCLSARRYNGQRLQGRVSLKCPIGHRVDISFENWTRDLRTFFFLLSDDADDADDL